MIADPVLSGLFSWPSSDGHGNPDTSGGKYVPPQRVESHFKTLCPYVGDTHVRGTRRPYRTAPITIDEEAIRTCADNNEPPPNWPSTERCARRRSPMWTR